MKKINSMFRVIFSFTLLLIMLFAGCKKRDISELQNVAYANTAEVFIDDFTGDLAYGAFGGSDVKAFQVDIKETYGGTKASMRFAVPDENSPQGAYAGGAFFSKTGRDLSGYNALTFYIKATQPANIGVVGFGNDFGASKYQVSLNGLTVNTNWKKVIIPIPDPSKLSAEKGMFFYSAGPENSKGYTFWIDEVKFENISQLGHPKATILNGNDKIVTSYIGAKNTIDGLTTSFNLPNGTNQSENITPYYFNYKSSVPAVADVNEAGVVSTIASGSTVISATLGNIPVSGSLTINSLGNYVAAPTPTVDPSNVISLFSDAYSNVPVDFYNGYWAPFQTTLSADFDANGDHVLNYSNFNFVGIQFSSPTINGSSVSSLHADIYLPNALTPGATLQIQVVDFGANGVFGGGDDVTGKTTIAAPVLKGQSWVGLNIPLSSFTGLTTKSHLAQIIFVGNNVSSFYADNIFFFSNATTPSTAAPTPSYSAADVISIFSNAYTNVAGTDLNPNWGQTTVVTQTPVAGDNTLVYTGLNYQGLVFGSNQDVSAMGFLHLDYFTGNSTSLKVYIISPGPVETPYTLPVPTTGWNSVDIPLSAFSPVALNNVIQMKFDGNGNIYLDNILFHK